MNTKRWLPSVMCMVLAACVMSPERDSADASPLDPRGGGADAGAAAWLTEPLTAQRALQAALAQSHEVQAELARLDAVEAERVQAGLLRNPMLSLMLLRPEGGGRFAVEAGWMQSLFDLLTRSRRIDLADAKARRERADIGARLLDIGWSAQAAYYEAVAVNRRAQLLRDEIALDASALDLQSRLSRQGVVSQAKLLEMQSMRDERLHMTHEIEAERIEALSMLSERIGLATRAGMLLPADFELPRLPAADIAAWQQRALSQRVELAATAAAVQAAVGERGLETGVLRNTEPDLGVQFERDAEGMVMAGPELRIALPLFDDGRARIDRVDAMVREAQHRDEAQRRAVLLAVERAVDLLFAAVDRLGAVETHLARTHEAATLAERRYRNGSIDLMAFIDARRAVLVAERQRLDARLALALAHVDLQRAVGAHMP